MMGDSPQQWKAALHQMWFAQYRREVQNDSSGFEHTVRLRPNHPSAPLRAPS